MDISTILNPTTVCKAFLNLYKGLPRDQSFMLALAHRDAPSWRFDHACIDRLCQKLIGAFMGDLAFAVSRKLRLRFEELTHFAL
nr:hypothetical protein [Henriciella marina]